MIKDDASPGPALWPVLLALVLVPLSGALEAQAPHILFDRITIQDGLSQSAVNDVLHDRRGFMWFATSDGLNRYDGYTFSLFKQHPDEPASLSHRLLLALEEDHEGKIWIGTDGGGLNLWDPITQTAVHFRNSPADPRTLSDNRVRFIFEDHNGELWIATDGGLNRLDRERQTFSRFNHNPADGGSLSHDMVTCIHEDRDGGLWVGTNGGGLNRLDRTTGEFVHYRHDPDDPGSLSSDSVRALFADRDDRLWVGTIGGGLSRLDPETDRFVRYRHDPGDSSSLSNDSVRAIRQDVEGVLWIGTEHGLNQFRPASDNFFRYMHDPTNDSTIVDNFINVIYQDRGGVLWVGTKLSGLSKWNVTTGFFPRYEHDPEDPGSLSNNHVMSFAEGANGTLWIGTFGGGLNRLDPSRDRIRHYRHDAENRRSLNGDHVMALIVDREQRLWIGTQKNGLSRLDPGSESFVRYPIDRDGAGVGLGAPGVMTLHEDGDGMLWIGTYQGGLNRLDPSTGEIVQYRHDPGNVTTVSNDIVTTIAEDSSGTFWVGTQQGGLNRFDRRTGTFSRYLHDPDDVQSLSSDVVLSIHEDRSGVLWIGTLGGGLNRWEAVDRVAHRGLFRSFKQDDGLPNDIVYGILEDDDGFLWLSTNRGLAKFDPESETFRHYDTSQGLQSDEFHVGAYHKTRSGELLFGGIRGFNVFDPGRIRDNAHVPPVVLTSFFKANREVPLSRPLAELEELEITYRDYVIAFEFAALDYTSPARNRYAYKLEPFDEDWIELGTLRRATYTNLNAGRYQFKVKGSNNDGIWNPEGASIGLRVIPPPWKTWWAYTSYGLLVLGAVFAYTRVQARKLEQEAEYSRKLEREVAIRTKELAQRNAQLEEANRNLEEASLTDSLTGLRNRRYVLTHIEEEVALAERRREAMRHNGDELNSKPDFLFLMFDLDGLKGINDNYGHATGDRLICEVRDLLARICRKSDTVVRWGGDEFLIVGRDADPRAAEHLAERVRNAVAEHDFDLGLSRPVRLSCSLGFAFHPFDTAHPGLLHWEQVLAVADRALYAAKKSGRNTWVGILSNAQDPPSDIFKRIYDTPEQMATGGVIQVSSSLPPSRELVWEM